MKKQNNNNILLLKICRCLIITLQNNYERANHSRQFYTQYYKKYNFYMAIIPSFIIEIWRILAFYTRMNTHKFDKLPDSSEFNRLLKSQRPSRTGIYALFGGFCLFYGFSQRLFERYRNFDIKTSAYKC